MLLLLVSGLRGRSLLTILATFARLIGVPTRLAEDALHSERAARHTLSRRGMMGALAAMAAGSVVSLPAMPREWDGYSITLVNGAAYSWESVKVYIGGVWFADVTCIEYDGPEADIGCHISEAIAVAELGRGGVGSGEG